jgi:hypothetical protein
MKFYILKRKQKIKNLKTLKGGTKGGTERHGTERKALKSRCGLCI